MCLDLHSLRLLTHLHEFAIAFHNSILCYYQICVDRKYFWKVALSLRYQQVEDGGGTGIVHHFFLSDAIVINFYELLFSLSFYIFIYKLLSEYTSGFSQSSSPCWQLLHFSGYISSNSTYVYYKFVLSLEANCKK